MDAICRLTCLLMLCGSAITCRADWLPQWAGAWQHPEAFHSAIPVDLLPAADGGLFAIIDTTHHNETHATLVRFDAQGAFEWLREDEALVVAGGVAVGADRIAIAGLHFADSSPQVFVRVHDTATGDPVHACGWSGVTLAYDALSSARAIAAGVDGTLLVGAHDGGDFVVLRCDAQGNELAEWRWTSGLADVRPDSVLVLADGDVLVGGRGNTGGGYFVVRFATDGSATLLDHELGQIGNPIGALHMAEDGHGDLLLATAPESDFGVPLAQVWKIAPDGGRLWTRIIEVPGDPHPNHDLGGFALAPDGDVLVATSPPLGPFRVLRLAGDDGSTRWDATSPLEFTPSSLALSPGGRVLVGGDAFIPGGGGRVTSRLVEFAADGAPCRFREDFGLNSMLSVTAGPGGWSVLGADAFVAATGSEAIVHRYDDTGACEGTDPLFADGFDGAS